MECKFLENISNIGRYSVWLLSRDINLRVYHLWTAHKSTPKTALYLICHAPRFFIYCVLSTDYGVSEIVCVYGPLDGSAMPTAVLRLFEWTINLNGQQEDGAKRWRIKESICIDINTTRQLPVLWHSQWMERRWSELKWKMIMIKIVDIGHFECHLQMYVYCLSPILKEKRIKLVFFLFRSHE